MGWYLSTHLLLYEQEQTGATKYRLLNSSLTHTFPGAFPQMFHARIGGAPKTRLYSRVKCEALPYPTR